MLLSTKQASKITGFCQGHICFLIKTGKLKATMIANSYVIKKQDLRRIKRFRKPNKAKA